MNAAARIEGAPRFFHVVAKATTRTAEAVYRDRSPLGAAQQHAQTCSAFWCLVTRVAVYDSACPETPFFIRAEEVGP